jgi:hypothetical protein
MGRQLIEYVKQHIQNENIKLKASDWAPKMIQALWDHMLRLWKYRNNALHENDTKKVAQTSMDIRISEGDFLQGIVLGV